MPRKDPGPTMPANRDSSIPGEWVVATDIGELASRNPAPSHRRPGAQRKAAPANSTSRTNPALLD
jgi:hypothetical protein